MSEGAVETVEGAAEGVAVADGTMETVETVGQTYQQLEKYVQSDMLAAVAVALVIVVVTAVLAHILTKFIRRVMNYEGSLLPANSLFLNIVRTLVWALGLSFMLSICFDVNVSALVTALGVGGIAISLGMQDTISNVIGGVNVSISGVVKPGDHIRLDSSGLQGVVHDVTLRQTVIEDRAGNQIIVPNAVINTSLITKLQSTTHVVIPVVVRAEDDRLTVVAHHMEKAVHAAVSRVSKVKKAPSAAFSEVTEYGYRGSMVFDIADADKVPAAVDAAVRAMAVYAHGNLSPASEPAVAKSPESVVAKPPEPAAVGAASESADAAN